MRSARYASADCFGPATLFAQIDRIPVSGSYLSDRICEFMHQSRAVMSILLAAESARPQVARHSGSCGFIIDRIPVTGPPLPSSI